MTPRPWGGSSGDPARYIDDHVRAVGAAAQHDPAVGADGANDGVGDVLVRPCQLTDELPGHGMPAGNARDVASPRSVWVGRLSASGGGSDLPSRSGFALESAPIGAGVARAARRRRRQERELRLLDSRCGQTYWLAFLGCRKRHTARHTAWYQVLRTA